MCRKCYMKLMKLRKSAELSEKTVNSVTEAIEKADELWRHYDSNEDLSACATCSHYETQKKGGRPLKPDKSTRRRDTETSRIEDTATSALEDYSFTPTVSSTPAKTSRTPDVPLTTTPPRKSKVLIDTATSPFQHQKQLVRPVNEITHPLTREERLCHTRMTCILVQESGDKQTLKCKTRGQPLIYKRVVQPRKASTKASSPLKKKRSRLLEKLRLDLSGDTQEAAISQHSSELKRIRKERREKILAGAGCPSSVILTKKQGSALRSHTGLSWTKYRTQRRFLQSIGVQFESEKKERQLQKDVLCGEI